MSETCIEVRKVSKSFRGRKVVDGLSLEVKRGETFGLLGHNVAARREVWRTLNHLKEKGLTLFLTTHYMEEAQVLCDRIALIKNGKKRIEGTVEEVIKSSPYDNLEEAYLWYMGEEVEC